MRSITMYFRDKFTSDQKITTTPERFAKQINKQIGEMTAAQRSKMIEHLGHYTNYYYLKHHRAEDVPDKTRAEFEKLSEKVGRMNKVDAAKDYLKDHGSPRQAFAKFLSRSRDRGVEVQQAKSAGRGMSRMPAQRNEQSLEVGLSR